MAGLGISICFWYVDAILVEEIIKLLQQGSYNPEFQKIKDIAKLRKVVEDDKVDLIISDFDLPDTLRDHIETFHRKEAFHVPFIYLVGENNERKAAETLKRGVWDYIVKGNFLKLIPTIYSTQKYGMVLRQNKRVVAEKQKHEAYTRILIDHGTDPLLIVDEDWDICFVNGEMADLLDYPKNGIEEITENLLVSVIDQYGNPHKEITEILSRHRPIESNQYYVGLRSESNKSIFGFLTFKKVYSEELSRYLYVLTFRDTTAIRKIERELIESEKKYLSIFNNVQDGMLLIDGQTLEIQEYNRSVLTIFGIDESLNKEQVVQQLRDRGIGYGKENISKIVKSLEDTDSVSFLFHARTVSGDDFWTENTIKRFELESKGQYLIVIRDIQEQKLLEESIRESREHFKNLAENSPDIIIRFDRNLRCLYVSRSVESQFGVSPEAFLGKTLRELGIFPAQIIELGKRNLLSVFEVNEPTTVEFDFDYKGKSISFEWRLFPEYDKDGKIESILTLARDVTNARLSSKAQRISEERLSLVVDATSLGYWDWNLITDKVYFSPIFMKMLGYGEEELPRSLDTWRSLIHEEDRDYAETVIASCIENRQSHFEIELRMRSKDGSVKWVSSRGRLVEFDEEDNPVRMIGTQEDISEQKRRDEIQSVLFNISNAVNTTRNLDELYERIREELGKIIDTTNCFLALYNKINNTLTLPFHRDKHDTFAEFPAGKTLTGYVLSTGQTQLIDEEKERKLSEEGIVELVGTPCISWLGVPLKANNNTIGAFVVQSYDESIIYTEKDVSILEFVSDQIAIAIERKRDQDNIRENQEKQRRIFESSPDSIIVVDKKGLIIDYNSAMLDSIRISDEPIHGQNVFQFIHKSYWREAILNFQRTWEEGYIKNLEFKVHRADGSVFECEVSTGAIYDNKGNPDSMVIIFKDIDERKESERNLREAKEKAEEADRLKTAFLSNMSHEIRTPMNAIVGFSDLLNDEKLDPKSRAEFIAQINLGADNLMHLIDDIIDISKIEAGQIKVNKSRVSINDLFKEQMILFRQSLERLDKGHIGIEVEWLYPKEELVLYTDPFRVKQVISNLLNNAIKFTDKGKIILRIAEENGFVRIAVQDTGIGISHEKQKMIFDRFMQGHSSKTRLYGGTGLGLAISRNLVSLLGGEIGVISEPGEGSEFWFILPKDECSKEEDVIQILNRVPDEKWNKKTILVAEDDNSNFALLSEVLRPTGIDIIRAKDGGEVVDLFKLHQESVNLVLMDIQMPVMDGYECTQIIKKIRPDMPVIAQTAYAMSGEREQSLEAGCDSYISKPIQTELLISVLGNYIK